MIYPTTPAQTLAHAARLSRQRPAPFVAVSRPPPASGHAFAAIPADELDDFLASGWSRIPNPALLNLTESPVTIDGVTLPPSGQVAEVDTFMTPHPLSDLLPAPTQIPVHGAVSGLPPFSDMQFYIVTANVAHAAQRPDCLVVGPDSLLQLYP